MFLEISMQIYSMVFALSRQINKQKVCKTVNPLCAGNKVFVKYQAEGGVLTPTPRPLVYGLDAPSFIIWSVSVGLGCNFYKMSANCGGQYLSYAVAKMYGNLYENQRRWYKKCARGLWVMLLKLKISVRLSAEICLPQRLSVRR